MEYKAVQTIRQAIRDEEKRLRSAYAILRTDRQDLVGFMLFLTAVVMWAAVSAAWLYGKIGGITTVVANAIIISVLHELEHDLIHDLYLKRYPIVQHLMFAVIWTLKANASSPWWRKRVHLEHHQKSGQTDDVEERLIGLGMPWSVSRLLLTIFPSASVLAVPGIKRDFPEFDVWDMVLCNPTTGLSSVVLLIHAVWGWPAAVVYNVCINFPNLLRQSCLVIVSTYVHYVDIPPKDVAYETQIIDHWSILPLQMFCMNFGKTHAIHHFVARQPFYLRMMLSSAVIPVMVEHGVRYNDMGAMLRANRW